MQIINHKALPSGTILDKKYEIIRELGSGGFGITYLANFIKLDTKVVIKEYFPSDLAHRETNSTIIPSKSDEAEFYEKGKERFLLEAKTIAKFKHPYIVRIIDYFEENNTAYFVMEYEDGNSLEEWLQTHKNLTEDDILPIIIPILDALTEIHTQHIYHRDIKPDNIIMRKDGVPLLIDFGAAKESDQQGSKASSFNPRTASYAAPEQKASISKYIGAHTDLYAIGALLHKVVTGKTPPTADDRSISRDNEDKDLYESLADKTIKGFSKEFLKNIDWCLQLKGKDRPQSAKELQKALMQKTQVTPEKEEKPKAKQKKEIKKEPQTIEKQKTQDQEKVKSKKTNPLLFIIIAVVVIIAGIVFYQVQNSNEQDVQKKAQELETLQNKLKEKESITKELEEKEKKRLAKIEEDKKAEATRKAELEKERLAEKKKQEEETARKEEAKQLELKKKQEEKVRRDEKAEQPALKKKQEENPDFRCKQEGVLAPEWTCMPDIFENMYGAVGVASKDNRSTSMMRKIALERAKDELSHILLTVVNKGKVTTPSELRMKISNKTKISDVWISPSGNLYLLGIIPKKYADKVKNEVLLKLHQKNKDL